MFMDIVQSQPSPFATNKPFLAPLSAIPAAPPVRSIKYWDSGRLVVFSAITEKGPRNTVLFQVHIDSLRCHSIVLDQIFDIPATPACGRQGTESNPIALPISAEEFETLLDFVNRRGWNGFEETSRQHILSLLAIASLLEADEALAYAISRVPYLGLPYAEKLSLAYHYRVCVGTKLWIEPAVRGLLKKQISEHTKTDEARMGIAYPAIARAREKMDHARTNLAAVPVPLAQQDLLFPRCGPERHHICEQSWSFHWYTVVTPRLIHPTKPLTYLELIDLVNNTTFEGLSAECKANVIQEMKVHGDFPQIPEAIEAAVAEVQELFK